MTRWLILASSLLLIRGLRLHSGTITPLQLMFKIADSKDEQDKTGIILMNSLDTLKCFDDIAHLLTIRTLKFRQFFKNNCSNLLDLGLAKRYGLFAVQRNLALAQMMGMDCLSRIENFGGILLRRQLYGVPVNSWTNLNKFSKKQVKSLLYEFDQPDGKHDLLFTGFLCFGHVEDVRIVHELFNHARNIFDGPFCEFNNRYSVSLTQLFLGISIDDETTISASCFDIIEIPDDKYRLIKTRLADPITAIDFIARFMQLTSAYIYIRGSSSTRIALSVPTSMLIHEVTMSLAEFTLLHSRYFAPWNLEVKAAVHLAKSVQLLGISANDFKKDLAKGGYSEEHQFFDLICNMTEQILNDEEISLELVDTVARLKIETLVVLSQFQISKEVMNSHVKSILNPRRFRKYLQRPRCRHLVVLMWALSKESKTYSETCRLLMEYVTEHMAPYSEYFEVFRRLDLLIYLPFSYKQREARKNITSQFSSQLIDEVIGPLNDTESTFLAKLPFVGHGPISFEASNGYLNNNVLRYVLKGQIATMLRQYMVYCGHQDSKPVYIQSLACHASVSSLFQLLLMFACILRLKLPFTLQQDLMQLIAKPEKKRYAVNYLHRSIQYELKDLSANDVETKIPQILMQIEQTKDLLTIHDPAGSKANYENWVDRLYNYRWNDRSNPEEKVLRLHDGLLAFGTALVNNIVMKTSFISMYELPGVSFAEGFAILLNQSPKPNLIVS